MKVTRYILAIFLGIFLANPGYFAEAADEQPMLRGILDPNSASAPGLQHQAAIPGETVDARAEVNNSPLTDDLQIEAKGKLDNQISSKHALQGGVSHTELNEPDDSASGQATHEIAAIGISWNMWNHVINYVDPGSDLFGKVEPGQDRFMGLGKLDALNVVRSGYNIGESRTWVDAVIKGRDRVVHHIPVRRQPLSNFAPKFARSLARQYRLSH